MQYVFATFQWEHSIGRVGPVTKNICH